MTVQKEWEGHQVITSFVHPSPDVGWDWAAYLDGWEEGPVGNGRTEEQAVADLFQQLYEVEDTDPQSIRRRR